MAALLSRQAATAVTIIGTTIILTQDEEEVPRLFVVRIQAQGKKPTVLNASVSNTDTRRPVTVIDGIVMSNALKAKISRRQLKERANAFSDLERWIRTRPAGGGVDAPFTQTWMVPDTKNERVDIDVFKGRNFIQ